MRSDRIFYLGIVNLAVPYSKQPQFMEGSNIFGASSKHHGPNWTNIHTHTHSFVKLSTKLLRKQLLVINSKFKYTPKYMKTQQKDLKKFATGGLPNIVIKCHRRYLIPTAPNVLLVEEELDFLRKSPITNEQPSLPTTGFRRTKFMA